MRSRPRLSYANVVSTLALIVAMSTGGAYAATLITTSQIADGAVTARKVAPNAIGREKLRDAAVGAPELAAGAVRASKLASAAVTGDKLAGGAVTTDKVPFQALTGDDIADGTLLGNHVLDGTIGQQDLQVGATAPHAYGLVWFDRTISNASPHAVLTDDMISQGTFNEAPLPGFHCISLPDEFSARAVNVTGFYSPANTVTMFVGAAEGCPAGTDVSVTTTRIVEGQTTNVDGSYYVNIWP